MPADIVLSTLNSSYFHSSFGLRYLYANLKDLKPRAKILEFTTAQKPMDLVEVVLAAQPKILGLGIYIWNTRESLDFISLLKKVGPEIKIVLGGPEVSFEAQGQKLVEVADYTIQGESEVLFYDFCTNALNGIFPEKKIIAGALPELSQMVLPYQEYTDEDIQHRVIYVEASRGCPYKCEFCLSSLDTSVRSFDLDLFLGEMNRLIERGVRQFKFVDRTFNLSITKSRRILQFFLDRISLGLFLHFELIPDRLPEELREIIQQFPKGSLQFEIGVQTWSPKVARLVSRRQDYEKLTENFNFLVQQTDVHIHSDLIAGLPGETLESFGAGLDRLAALKPHEIQVGILKRLKGTPIIRHDKEWEMVYQEHPPFQVVKTKTMPFQELLGVARFAKFWDLYSNSGNFKNAMALLKALSEQRPQPSLFWEFWEFSEFLNQRHPQRYGIALLSQVESIWIYLTEHKQVDPEKARAALILDYATEPKRDIPNFMKSPEEVVGMKAKKKHSSESNLKLVPRLPQRQSRHLNPVPH